jgi:hypothetical protein
MQPTGLTGDTGLIIVPDRSDRSPCSGSVDDTSLTVVPNRFDRSSGKNPLHFFDKNKVEDRRKPLVDYLRNPSRSVDKKVR